MESPSFIIRPTQIVRHSLDSSQRRDGCHTLAVVEAIKEDHFYMTFHCNKVIIMKNDIK